MSYDLSILIPARNEEFLKQTVEDILRNKEGKTEIIVVLDGYTTDLPTHPDLRVIHNEVSIGQRAATNQACLLSEAKYIIKTDAHCAFDKGFDVKLMADMQDDWVLVPVMRNLHVFNWVCENGHKRYQGKSGVCETCDKPTVKHIVWIPKTNPQSTCYRFDNTLHFQYWNEYGKTQKGDLIESMSIQGSFFMVTREKYLEWNICDEGHGSWGQQGTEVACKAWLSGGRVMISRKTWYAHMFRTQGGDFGFPYPNPGIEQARAFSRKLWLENTWDKAIYPLDWLIKKFNPPGWNVSKGILYYTDNQLDEKIMKKCQQSIKEGAKENRIVSVSLKPIDFGDNITLPLERGYLTMAKQILAGLKELDTDIVFFCEHDVIYDPSHFDFIPERKDVYYYNVNVWRVRLPDGFSVRVEDCRQLSGLCGYRETLIKHYEERIRRIETEGFSRKMGFEPGTHNRKERVDDLKSGKWKSEKPNYDIRHKTNLTSSRWKREDFRNQKYTVGWEEKYIYDII